MDPGLFIAGTMAGMLFSWAWQNSENTQVPPGPPPAPMPPGPMPSLSGHGPTPRMPPLRSGTHPDIAAVEERFLPMTAQNIQAVRQVDPNVQYDWRSAAERLPMLSEAVAMFYAMEDPAVPLRPKLQIAASILYGITPVDVIPDAIPGLGHLDDAAVILGALYDVYAHIEPRHLLQAQEWLRSQGIEPKPLFAIGKDFSADIADAEALEVLQQAPPGSEAHLRSQQPQLPASPPQLPGPVQGQDVTPFEGFGEDLYGGRHPMAHRMHRMRR
jgi:uncharacterized membrane protein YkvA (DUF1232 family)